MIRDDIPESIVLAESGLYRNIPEALYHARVPGVANKTALSLIDKAPAVYGEWLKAASDDPSEEEKEAFAFGKAFHAALLEPHVYERDYAVTPKFGDCRKTENKKLRDEWNAENEQRTKLTQSEATRIRNMVRAIEAHPRARHLFRGGVPELTLRWVDEDTGLICKGRVDYFIEADGDTGPICVDLKSCTDARPGAFSKSASMWGYDRQCSFYEQGFSALGVEIESFVFVAIEKTPPHLIGLYYVEQADIDAAREWTRERLADLYDCIEQGRYPGLSEEILPLTIRRWAA